MLEKLAPLQAIIDRLRRKSTFFNHFCLYWHTRRLDFKKKPPLLIYQMSKVGSSSVYDSLRAANINYHIFHIHYLMEKRHRLIEEHHKKRSQKLPAHISISKALTIKVKKQRHEIPWKIITLVRDPVKRYISGCFQRAYLFQHELQDNKGNWSEEKIKHFIEERLYQFDEKTDFDCNWFDEEIKTVFDIDVFDYPFPKEEGYQIIEKNNVELLIFRLEDLNTTFQEAIKRFFGLDRAIPLVQSNIAEDKEYSEVYKNVSKNITIPEEICRKIYGSKLVRHFYNDESREKMVRQWLRSPTQAT